MAVMTTFRVQLISRSVAKHDRVANQSELGQQSGSEIKAQHGLQDMGLFGSPRVDCICCSFPFNLPTGVVLLLSYPNQQ